MQEQAKAGQGAGARQPVKKTSRNLLDEVGESLQRQLQVDKPTAKRRLAKITNIDKRSCIAQVIPSVDQQQWKHWCHTGNTNIQRFSSSVNATQLEEFQNNTRNLQVLLWGNRREHLFGFFHNALWEIGKAW